jgi:putative ABC transport system substrate-binding protein
MNRRAFITLLGGAAVGWPLGAQAQQAAMPVVGVLGSASAQFKDELVRGLGEAGYFEGQNVRIEYRWAAGAYDQLSAMADELVNLRVNVIATLGAAAAPVAKAASTKVSPSIPVVFVLGSDPVAEGLVASLNRPGGNVTGATTITGALTAKRLELLRAAVGGNAAMAILINPSNPLGLAERSGAEAAARDTNQTLEIVTARNESEIVATFASLTERRIGALIIGSDSFYLGQMRWMAALAAHNRVPARPADLPVVQPTKFELAINLKAAKALGLDMPPTLLATADEVIE